MNSMERRIAMQKASQATTRAPYAPLGCSNPNSSDVTRKEIEEVCGTLGSFRPMSGAMLALALSAGMDIALGGLLPRINIVAHGNHNLNPKVETRAAK